MPLFIDPKNPMLVSDAVGRSLSFVPKSPTSDPAKAAEWAQDFLVRTERNNLDSVEAALTFVGFRPDDLSVTGPQVDGRIKRNRQLSQHRAQVGLPASSGTSRNMDRMLTILREQGPAAGISDAVIAEWLDRADLAFDQAGSSLVIAGVSRVLVRRGLLSEEVVTNTTVPVSTDAPVLASTAPALETQFGDD